MKRDLELQDEADPVDGADRGGAGSGVRNRFKADPAAVIDPAHSPHLLVASRRQASLGTGDLRPPVDRAVCSLPDADTTVCMWVVYEDGDGDWAAGWWDGDVWRDASTGGPCSGEVTHYAQPSGPAC